MPINISSYVSYFRACYEADNRELSLLNFNAKKVEQQWWLDGTARIEEWEVTEEFRREKLQTTLDIHRMEKELMGCFFFVIGKTRFGGKLQQVCAPLLLTPLVFENKIPAHFVERKDDFYRLNPSVLQILAAKDEIEDPQTYLLDRLPVGIIDTDFTERISELLEEVFTNLDTSELANFPILYTEKMAKKLMPKEVENFTIIPSQALGILQKSRNTRAQLNDLAALANEAHYSTPMEYVLGNEIQTSTTSSIEETYVPVTLSIAQQNILQSVMKYPLTVAIGPPGTGKSFTIAATALDQIAKGRSVLICSQNYQALEVVARKIREDYKLPDIAVEAGHKDWKKDLKERLQLLLQNIGYLPTTKATQKKSEKAVKQVRQQANNWASMMKERTVNEIKWAALLDIPRPNLWVWVKQKWLIRKFKGILPLWKVYDEFHRAEKLKNKLITSLLRVDYNYYVGQTLRNHRWDLKNFLAGIRSRTGQKRAHLFNTLDFKDIFGALPLWLVSLSDLNSILPLQKELFDVLIIDEASQCDMASALPALQRAKKVLIVGDPRQLRHLSFLSRQRQKLLQEKEGIEGNDENLLNFRDHSLLDIALDKINLQKQVHFLNEHFRSHPSIISFSNQQFYRSSLRLMTQTPANYGTTAVFIKTTAGKRSARGYNEQEGQALIQFLQTRITTESKEAVNHCTSIGILSPFREQVRWLQKTIEETFGLSTIERHKILIGTAYDFQGEERDMMLLSMALDDDTHRSAYQFLNRSDVFNVSITRARKEQYLFVSFTLSKLSNNWLIAKYFSHVQQPSNAMITASTKQRDRYLNAVNDALQARIPGTFLKDHSIAGISIDIVIWQGDRTYGIDLIGFVGEYGEALSPQQLQILNRVGVEVFPLTFSEWLLNQNGVIEVINSKLI